MCLPESASSNCLGQTKGRMPRSGSALLGEVYVVLELAAKIMVNKFSSYIMR
jgi:hypothetical protein